MRAAAASAGHRHLGAPPAHPSPDGGRARRVPSQGDRVYDNNEEEDDDDDFVVAHPMTRISFAGKVPILSLATIHEESSLSNVDGSLDCVDLDEEENRDEGVRGGDSHRRPLSGAYPQVIMETDLDGNPLEGPEASKPAAVTRRDEPPPPSRLSWRARQRNGIRRVVRSFWAVIVTMLVVDVVLFVISYAWTPMFIFALTLLGMVMGMLLSGTVWCITAMGGARLGDESNCAPHLECTTFPIHASTSGDETSTV